MRYAVKPTSAAVAIISQWPLPGTDRDRSDPTTDAGTITATLTSVGPPALTVGLGLGITGAGPPCSLATTINASLGSSTQVVGSVDPGRYCVQVFDLGTVTDPLAFVVTIQHP